MTVSARVLAAVLAPVALVLLACSSSPTTPTAQERPEQERPEWLGTLIAELEQLPPGNPERVIYRYDYQGQVVYYLPPQCCDIASALYDASGRYLCAPDGGFTGIGDGRCTDFTTLRTGEHLLWRDRR